VPRLAAQVHARGGGRPPPVQGGDRHGGADRLRHEVPGGLQVRAPRPGGAQHPGGRAQHRQDRRLRLRANAQRQRQARAVAGREQQVPGQVDGARGLLRRRGHRAARLHHQVGRLVVWYGFGFPFFGMHLLAFWICLSRNGSTNLYQ